MNCKLKIWLFTRLYCYYNIEYIEEEREAILEWPPPKINKIDYLNKSIDFIYPCFYALKRLPSELRQKIFHIILIEEFREKYFLEKFEENFKDDLESEIAIEEELNESNNLIIESINNYLATYFYLPYNYLDPDLGCYNSD